MIVITAEQAEGALDYGDLIRSLREAHRGPRIATDDAYLEQPALGAGPNGFLVRPAWQHGELLGAKLATVFPENSAKELHTIHSVYVLFDGTDGRPLAFIDSNPLTWFKTACDSALGASYLAREDALTLTMVGAGAMAPHLIKAHLAVRPSLRRIKIWNRTAQRALELAQALELELDGREIMVVHDLPAAVADSDLISVATRSLDGVIAGADIASGTHLDLVGAYTPEMREVDDEAVRRSRVFVDLAETALLTGELLQPIAAGVMSEDDIVADLYELAQGLNSGRQSRDEITLFKNGGGGHLDLMTAKYLLQRV